MSIDRSNVVALALVGVGLALPACGGSAGPALDPDDEWPSGSVGHAWTEVPAPGSLEQEHHAVYPDAEVGNDWLGKGVEPEPRRYPSLGTSDLIIDGAACNAPAGDGSHGRVGFGGAYSLAGDLNADGLPDLLARCLVQYANYDGDEAIEKAWTYVLGFDNELLRHGGEFSSQEASWVFAAKANSIEDGGTSGLATHDFDGDGYPEMLIEFEDSSDERLVMVSGVDAVSTYSHDPLDYPAEFATFEWDKGGLMSFSSYPVAQLGGWEGTSLMVGATASVGATESYVTIGFLPAVEVYEGEYSGSSYYHAFIHGNSGQQMSGGAFGSAFDVDGDGTNDFFKASMGCGPDGVGAHYFSSVYFVSGDRLVDGADIDIADADHSLCDNSYNWLNINATTPIDDINGDGYADIITSVPGYDFGSEEYVGSAFLFFGGPWEDWPGFMYEDADIRWNGEREWDYLGANMFTSPDQDGDGHPELLMAVGADPFGEHYGRLGVWASSELPASGVLAPDDNTFGFVGHPYDEGERDFGWNPGFDATADFDGDGVLDLVVSDARYLSILFDWWNVGLAGP